MASLLCAFEKDGYGKLVLLADGVAGLEDDLRSSCGFGKEFLRVFGGDVIVALRSGRVGDLSASFEDDFRIDRLDLRRVLSLGLDGSASRSRGPSRSLLRSPSRSRTFVGIFDSGGHAKFKGGPSNVNVGSVNSWSMNTYGR